MSLAIEYVAQPQFCALWLPKHQVLPPAGDPFPLPYLLAQNHVSCK